MQENSKLSSQETPKPDWLIANMQGAVPKTLGGMHKEGVASSMFDIAAPDDYWSSDKIRAAFTDDTGAERKDLFQEFYKTQLDNYNAYRTGEHALLNYNNSPNVTAKKVGAKTPEAVIYKSKPDAQGRSYSSLTGYSGPEYSIREAAIKRGGKLSDGSYVKPEEYKGLLRFAREDNGDWKYDEEGHPYLEPFDREKNLRQFDEVYNPTAKDWGYYGHTWDWTMLGSSVIKNPINFLVSALDSLAEYPKSLLANLPGEVGGGEGGDAYKGIVSSENWAKQFKIGNTDEGQEFFSLENITDLGQQVFYQLATMRGVGKGIGSMTGSAEAGSVASKIYMVGLAAGPMADVARDAGLSQREQALMLGLTTGLFYPLMNLSESALGGLASQESQAAIRDLIKPLGIAVKSGDKAKMAAQLLNIRPTIANLAYNVEKALPKNGWGMMARGSALEATEEVAEQAVDLGLRTLYNGYNMVSQGSDVAQMLGTTTNRFEIDPIRELQLLGHSAIGGAIGGSIAAGVFNKWNNENNEVARQLHDMILDGKEQVFYDYLKNMHEAGRLDHAWATSKDELVKPGEQSRNDEAYNILKGVADYLVELRDNAGIKDLYKNNNAKAGAFKELLKTSSVGKDVADLHRDVLSLQARLDSEKASKTPNAEQIGQTEAELQGKVELLNKIKNGEFVTDYVIEGLYNLGAISGSRPALNINILDGKGFNTITKALTAIQGEETAEADKFNIQLGQGDATATLDNFADISDAGKQRLIGEGITNLQKAGTALEPHFEALQDLAAVAGDEINKDNLLNADPAKRQDDVNFLRNTVLPQIQDQTQKDAVLKFLDAADKLNKVETFNPLGPKSGPDAVQLLTRMTQTVDKSVIPSSVPIATRIQEELDYRKTVNEQAGASVYTNTPKLQNIFDSINKRLAQIEGMRLMGPSINNFLMTRGKDKIAEFTPDELAMAETHLKNQQAMVAALILESEENNNNSENRIREITINRIKESLRAVDYASELSASTDYPIFQTVNTYREGIFKAMQSGDFIATQRLFMQMEDELFDKFSEKKAEILKTLFKEGSLDVFKLQDPANSHIVEAYNYMRGVLSVKSSDFWNAYHEAYKDSKDEKPSPSWEQDMAVKRTFQSLAADNYNPTSIAAHPNRINHHSTVFVQGRGGAGKSDYVIPTVAAIYQKKFGGKVLLSAYKDSRDTKRTKLVESVKNFYPKLNTVSVNKSLLDILRDPGMLKDVNLIIFDEATLLTSTKVVNGEMEKGELELIHAELYKLNVARKNANMATLKLLLTGDTLQNSINVDLNHPDLESFGIDHAQRHVVDRVPPLKFSFRQGNQQLILLANYFEKVQGESGRSDGFQAEYKGKKGARVISDEKEFTKHVLSMLEGLKTKNELGRAVYITDKSQFDLDPRIVSTGVPIMNSVEAQGEQWDIVIYDPKNKSLFTEGKNAAIKKDAYTSATRAKEYFVALYPENSGLTSREGVVNDIKPLNLARFNKEAKLDDIVKILGDSAAPVKQTQARKDVHILPEFDLFPGSQSAAGPAPTPPPSASPGAPASVPKGQVNEGLPKDVDRWLGEQETKEPGESYTQEEAAELAKMEAELAKSGLRADKVAKHTRENVKGDFVGLHTFYTDTTTKVLPEVLDRKRKALYDRKTIQSSPYFITVAKIGSAEYATVIRNNPEFNGEYAMFLEADVEGERVILGVFSLPDFDKFVTDSGIMGEAMKLTLPVPNSILAEAQGWRPWSKTGDEQKLAEIKKKSPGIQFGTPRIHRIDSPDANVKGQPKFRRGDIFIPVSFKFTPTEVDRILNTRGSDEHIARIELRSVALPFNTVAQILERFVTKNDKGKWVYKFNEESGKMYDAFWGNLAKVHKNKDGKLTEPVLTRAFKDLYTAAPQGAYKTFLSRYAGTVDAEVAEVSKGLSEAGLKSVGKRKESSNSSANYFMANYLVAKNTGAQEIRLFDKAIQELSAHPAFKHGFDFDPRAEYDSTLSSVFEHMQAQNLPSGVYDNMLKASVSFVSQPSLQLPKESLVNVLKKAFAVDNVPATSTTETGKVSNQSPSDPNNDTKRPDVFDQLGDTSILSFYNRWFKKPGYITFLPQTIFNFRNMVFNSIFSLNNSATGPRLREINDVIKEFREEYAEFKKKYPGSFLNSLDPVNDEKARELYMLGVIYNEMPFLLRKYFPTIVKKDRINPETGKKESTYVYRSSHHKQTHFNEKESFNLLADGMTEMVKTQLYNTPMIQRGRDGFKTTRDFINPSHIESMVKMVKGATTTEEVAEKLLDSGSDLGLSLYNRFYNPDPFKLDGKETRSVGSIAHPEVRKMVDSVSLFMLSGQVFDLASVDIDNNTFALPNQAFGVPNILKEIMHQSLNSVSQDQKDQIYSFDDGSYVINQVKIQPSKNKEVTEDDLVKAAGALGLTNFTKQVLQDMYTYDATKLAVTPHQDEATTQAQVRSQLMDSVIIPIIEEMKTGEVKFSGRTSVLYDAIARAAGIKGTLSHKNINGEIMYRLRYTAPLYRLKDRIEEIRDDDRSVVADNLLVKGNYEIVDTYLWEGVKSEERPKSHTGMTADETMELDIIWGFAYTLNEDHRKGKKYNTTSFPGMVYSDSTSDVKFIVKAKDGYFRSPAKISEELFTANSLYMQKLGAEITQWWNQFFQLHQQPVQFNSLPEVAAYLDANEVPSAAVSMAPGVIRNLFFVNRGGRAAIKPSLVADYQSLTGSKGLSEFQAKLDENYKKLAERAKTITDASGNKLWDKLNKLVDGRSSEVLLKAFYYNWVSFSQQLHLITNGPEYQYDDKGKGESQEYIDLVKRAKLQISNRSHQLFRNKSWLAFWKEAKTKGLQGPQLEALRYEGKKLPRVGRIAYVKDPVKALVNLVGETKMQEVMDGGTFVSPLTRLMQYHSNAGEHGINASPVMKNVTTYYNNRLGTNTSIKNAEFLITPEIIRQGHGVAGRMVQRMLMVPFDAPINGKNNAYELIQTLPGESGNVAPDLRNVTWQSFEQLLDLMVDNAQQDKLILEVAPITSVKTGIGAVNEIDPGDEQIFPYLSTAIDLVSKGTQLDASHKIEDIPNIIAPTQGIGALVLNWADPVAIQRIWSGLVQLGKVAKDEFVNKSDFELIERMKAFVAKSVANKENISYLTEITDPSNGNQFSLDDRQIVNSFVRNFNAHLSDNAITPEFKGGHFILHPTSGLIPVFEVGGRVGLRSTFKPEELGDNPGRDLKWASPVRKDGKTLQQLVEEIYISVTGAADLVGSVTLAKNPEIKAKIAAEIAALHATLKGGEWKPGFAEVLLPAEMFKDFGIKDFNLQPDQITPQYFAQLLREKNKNIDRRLLTARSIAMHKAFQMRLAGILARVPGTGPHSAVATKAVGFMNESQNAAFVPAELLFVQGADQDIDKGFYMTLQTVHGMLPEVDENYQLINPEIVPAEDDKPAQRLFADTDVKRATLAGIKNDIVKNYVQVSSHPANAIAANMSVDESMQEWIRLAQELEGTSAYSRYDFTSYADMKEINQSGKNMVGIFANANKAYQVLYASMKAAGVADSGLAGLNDEYGTVWVKLAALINLATDNAKLQVLGRLGIGEHNGNMVAYLVMKGASPKDIVKFLQDHKTSMQQLKDSRRFDVEGFFNVSESWGDNDLISTYYLGQEIGTLARFVMNRGVPSGPDEMYSFIFNMNKAINNTYKRTGQSKDFDLIRFLSSESIRKQQVAKYGKLSSVGGEVKYSDFNILQAISSAPHIMGYLDTFNISHQIVNKVSKAYKVTNAIIENMEEFSIKPDYYRDVQDFTYGLFIHDYFKANDTTIGSHKLATVKGRMDFVAEVTSQEFIDTMKLKYPDNSFVNSLSREDHKRYGFETRKRLRTHDLMQMLEEKLLRLRVDFANLDSTDREKLVAYHLIMDKGRISKGSFGQLFEAGDLKAFNHHLTQIDPTKYDFKRLSELYYSFKRPGDNGSIPHNTIPYTEKAFGIVDEEGRTTAPVQMSQSATVPAETSPGTVNLKDLRDGHIVYNTPGYAWIFRGMEHTSQSSYIRLEATSDVPGTNTLKGNIIHADVNIKLFWEQPKTAKKPITEMSVAEQALINVPVPRAANDILIKYEDGFRSPRLMDNIEDLQRLSKDPKVTATERALLDRLLNNYHKFVKDRSDKETLQRIIDCA